MARPKYIEDTVLLNLIKQYFDNECNNDIQKLKASEITKYINTHGYPDYPASTLRRTPIAMEYIEELKKAASNEHYVTVVAYQTIDATSMVDSNRSRNRLISAITERDCYYKKIADSAAYHFEKYNELKKEYDLEKEKNDFLAQKTEELEKQIIQYKSEIKQLINDLTVTNNMIKTYIYPEIANELLAKEGAIRKTPGILKDGTLEKNIITTATNIKKTIKSDSNIIKGLYIIEDV